MNTYLFSGFVLLASLGTQVAEAQPVRPYQVGNQMEVYIRELNLYSRPAAGEGVFSGELVSAEIASSSFDQFHGFGYIQHVCVPMPISGGCLYEHDYGAKIDWDFNVNGIVKYKYTIPFTAHFEFPKTVYPGQRIYLTPRFEWSSHEKLPKLEALSDYTFSHKSSAWFDAPFDGLDDLSIKFTQYAPKASIDLQFPVLPLLPSVPLSTDITVPPFNTGGGEFGGSYTKLGGVGQLVSTGGRNSGFGPTDIYVRAWDISPPVSSPAWQQGHEQFGLISSVLVMIPTPATVAAGAALAAVRAAGDFRLDTQLNGRIGRDDWIGLAIADLPHVDVPVDVGSTWTFTDLSVAVKYRVMAVSSFWYQMGYGVTFDMRGIDPQPILQADGLFVPAGGMVGEWTEREGSFKMSGTIPVVSRPEYRVSLLRAEAYAAHESTGQPVPTARAQLTLPAGALIASKEDTQKVIRTTTTIEFPRPSKMQGTPAPGHYVVTLGLARTTMSKQIIELLKTKGISAFAVRDMDPQSRLITLGSFSDKAHAETLSHMLREIFDIRSSARRSIAIQDRTPLGEDFLSKLRAH